MTLHASKRLEFSYSFLVGMVEGLLPHQSSINENNIDEEHGLAYVGITRAQKELTFALCRERRQYGELVKPEPSRFLLELPQDDFAWEQVRKPVSAEEQMSSGQGYLTSLRAQLARSAARVAMVFPAFCGNNGRNGALAEPIAQLCGASARAITANGHNSAAGFLAPGISSQRMLVQPVVG